MLEERGAFHDVDGVRRALDRLLPTIRATVDPSLRDIYISRVAERTGVRRETLERQAAATGDDTRPGGRAERPAVRPAEPRPGRAADGFASERLLVKLLLRDPERLAQARAALQGARLHDPRYRAIYEALAAGTPVATLPALLGGPAAAVLEQLQREANEITDADGTFNSTVADIRVPDIFIQVQYVDDRLEGGVADVGLLRQRQELQAELQRLGAEGRLGAKTSRRYRSRLRGFTGDPKPLTPDD
jgi:hypothetical protein